MEHETFHQKLHIKINDYVHCVYKVSRKFPKEELYGMTSQLRRASLSIALNYIEGYARGRTKVHKNFLEIAYGSLKESQYLIKFAEEENFITISEATETINLGSEIGAMLWGVMSKIK